MSQELREAAQRVLDSWETGDLADAVNEMSGVLEDERSQQLADASTVVVDAMVELYRLNDGDELAVGEALYEINKAARRTYAQVTQRPKEQ